MQELSSAMAVGEVVAHDPRTAAVFIRHGIDFCCGGRRSIADACRERELDASVVLSELLGVARGAGAVSDVTTWPPPRLIAHIVERHHGFVREQYPLISGYLEKMVARHGKAHPELAEIGEVFASLIGELLNHMHKEEAVLFPYIERMTHAAEQGTTIPRAPFGRVTNPVAMMELEHEHAAEALGRLRTLTREYVVPPEGCATWRASYDALAAFDRDLQQHVHLENSVLFPAALRLEDVVRGL